MTTTETKNPTDDIITTTTIVLDWKDRLKVLFGWKINYQCTNRIEYLDRPVAPFRATFTNDNLWLWFPRPNWLKPKLGECMQAGSDERPLKEDGNAPKALR